MSDNNIESALLNPKKEEDDGEHEEEVGCTYTPSFCNIYFPPPTQNSRRSADQGQRCWPSTGSVNAPSTLCGPLGGYIYFYVQFVTILMLDLLCD